MTSTCFRPGLLIGATGACFNVGTSAAAAAIHRSGQRLQQPTFEGPLNWHGAYGGSGRGNIRGSSRHWFLGARQDAIVALGDATTS